MITTTKTTKMKMMTMMMMMMMMMTTTTTTTMMMMTMTTSTLTTTTTFTFPSFLSLSLLPSSFLHSIHQLTAFACNSYYHLLMPHLRMVPFRSKLHRLAILSLVGPVWHKQCQCCITSDTAGQCTGFDLGWELLHWSLVQSDQKVSVHLMTVL